MRQSGCFAAILFVGLNGTGIALAGELAADQPASVGGVESVCTGTSLEARSDPRWDGYGLRLEFSGWDGHYLGDEDVNITGNGQSVNIHCAGPWILLKLPEGDYKIAADVADAGHKDVTAHVPATGQARIIVNFPNAGKIAGPDSPG